jgi:hypothetical protein
MAIRVLLVLAIFVTLYGCGQMSAQNGHPDKKDKKGCRRASEEQAGYG